MAFQAKKLSEPIQINRLELKNRIATGPLMTNFATDEGDVTDQRIAYYEERAKGKPGLIICEVLCVDFPEGKGFKPQLGVYGVAMRTGVSYKKIADQGLIIQTREGVEQTIKADTIVVAAGSNPNNELIGSLQGEVPELYSIGDCVRPGLISDALRDAARVGRAI